MKQLVCKILDIGWQHVGSKDEARGNSKGAREQECGRTAENSRECTDHVQSAHGQQASLPDELIKLCSKDVGHRPHLGGEYRERVGHVQGAHR